MAKKLATAFVVSLIILTTSLYLTITSWDFSQYLTQQLQISINQIDSDFIVKISGPSRLSIFPLRIRSEGVAIIKKEDGGKIAEYFNAPRIDIKADLFAWWQDKRIVVEGITIRYPKINLAFLYNVASSPRAYYFNKFDIIGGNIYAGKKGDPSYSSWEIVRAVGNSIEESFQSETLINLSGTEYNLSLDFDKESGTKNFILQSPNFQLNFDSSVSKDGAARSGTLSGKGKKFASVLHNILWQTPIDTAAASDEFNIKANLHLDPRHNKIEDIEINSTSLNLKGNLEILENKEIYSTWFVNSMDLDALGKGCNTQQFLPIVNTLLGRFGRYQAGNTNLIIKNLSIGGESIKDISISGLYSDKKIHLTTTKINLPGDSILEIEGAADSNKLRSRFFGKFSLSSWNIQKLANWLKMPELNLNGYKSLDMRGSFYIADKIIDISDASFRLDDNLIEGEAKFRSISGNTRLITSISSSNVELEKLYYNFSKLTKVSAYSWLKKNAIKANLEIEISNFTAFSQKFDTFQTRIEIKRGELYIQNLDFNSEKWTGRANLYFSASDEPSLFFNLYASKFHSEIFAFQDLVKKTFNSGRTVTSASWVNKPLSLEILNGVKGGFGINIDQLTATNNLLLSNLSASGRLTGNSVNLDSLSFQVGGGNVAISGSAGASDKPSLLISMSASDVSLKPILSMMEITNASGQASISAIAKGEGATLHELIGNLDSEAQFIIKGARIEKVNIDEVIKKALLAKSRSEIATLSKITLYDGFTFFDTISGSINLSRSIAQITGQLKTLYTVAAFSANYSVGQFLAYGIFRFFFSRPNKSTGSVEMNLEGPIWNPKFYLDTNQLYNAIVSN